jgi:site-specific DNA recombinase
LGYDVDPCGSKLVVQAVEAKRVRAIFRLYREHEALLPVVRELARRGWVSKQWLTRKGRTRGGQRFTKTSLYRLLTQVAYIGKINYRGESHDGEHAGIVELELWQQVQELLRQHGPGCRGEPRTSSWALLKGLLRCRPCGCAMTPTFTVRGCKRYRYYVCANAQKHGRDVCPSQSIAATELERLVVQRLQAFAGDPQFPEAERAAIASVADPVAWQALPTAKQALALRRVLERVEYDGDRGKVCLTLWPVNDETANDEECNAMGAQAQETQP